jgi:nitrogen-specific signal transduction histidine kinase
MKKVLLTVVTVLATSLSALAGTDFNSLIVENSKAQNELHDQIKSNVDEVKIAVQDRVQDGSKTVSIAAETIHVNTDKKFLTFAKEKKYYKPSEAKAQKRLAEEFQNLE